MKLTKTIINLLVVCLTCCSMLGFAHMASAGTAIASCTISASIMIQRARDMVFTVCLNSYFVQ